jgi:hypothetical protein
MTGSHSGPTFFINIVAIVYAIFAIRGATRLQGLRRTPVEVFD